MFGLESELKAARAIYVFNTKYRLGETNTLSSTHTLHTPNVSYACNS